MPSLDAYGPHFAAQIMVRRVEDGGPSRGRFGFPETGVRNVPLGLAAIEGYNTVQLRAEPSLQVESGSSFTAYCRLLYEPVFIGRIAVGTSFVLWDCRPFADGVVTKVFPQNWSIVPQEQSFVSCAKCKGTWPDPGDLSLEVLSEAGHLASQTDSIRAIAHLRKSTGMSLTSAKGVLQHLARDGRTCHRCGHAVCGLGAVACDGCCSLNYAWKTA